MNATDARRQHYAFAHAVLRDLALTAPERLLAAALDGSLDAELRALWRQAAAGLPPGEQSDEWPAGRLVGHDSVLVTLPPAVAPPEAHFVLVTAPPGAPVRYATLEASPDAAGRPAAMLCMWAMTADGPAHASTLQFLPPREDRFLDAAMELPSVPPTFALS
ncbi:hypothetical protein O7599_10520 [Streptomyces sp. WMMC500]|uniref:hypothetical protein n=1 Tax=Streptomyces sp. WMMC500 TaxID=3015154 RepID=UPI00248B890F|nr:hypothetical protein [Streptomyces sp. WMMC500]WBB62928.1 hypothetical protein O7599_10520 [Streptomyces sp. WMMC500]